MSAIVQTASSLWPVTAAGWVSLLLAILALLSALYAYAKNLAHLNGLGERVTKVETGLQATQELGIERSRLIASGHAAQEALSERIGRSDKGAERGGDDMHQWAIDLGSKIDNLAKQGNAEWRSMGERLQAVETELRLMRNRGQP